MTTFRAPLSRATGELRDRGSRFLAWVAPAAEEEVAQAVLGEVRERYRDATHHCWAWRLGAAGSERSSDDGEPAGTAGRPMLQVLRGADLSDVVAVVIRWYGGVKLGKGGLARAYSGAVKEALVELDTEERWPTTDVEIELPYDKVGAVKRWLDPPEIVIRREEYADRVRLVLTVRSERLPTLEERLAEIGLEAGRA